MTVMLNSRSNLSCTISMCNIPKNPHLNPKPSAADDSGAYVKEASFNCSFSMEFLSSSKSSVSTG